MPIIPDTGEGWIEGANGYKAAPRIKKKNILEPI
jgi:hypothetical protein